MKFETVRIYLVKWRFWFVVWSKNFATVATWHKDFSSLLEKQQQQQPCTCAAHFFVHFFDVVLHDYNVKLYVGICRMCSPMFCHVPVHFFSTLPLIFTLLAPFLIFSPPISMFFEICLLFLPNDLALLLTSLKTLKCSLTWFCRWFFSLLSPDGLSLFKKSGWTLGFPPKNPVLHLPHLLIELFYINTLVVRKGLRTLTWLFIYSEPKFLPMVHRCARENFGKNVCGEPRRQKRQNRPLSRGSHFVSGDLKSFVYAQLAL